MIHPKSRAAHGQLMAAAQHYSRKNSLRSRDRGFLCVLRGLPQRPPHFKISQNRKRQFASAIFPVEEVAHGFTPSGVGALVGLQWVGGVRASRFFFAAIRTAVRKTGLPGFEFKFFAADCTGLDGIGHISMIQAAGLGTNRLGAGGRLRKVPLGRHDRSK